jgi:predicted YcjX-like family ATPase
LIDQLASLEQQMEQMVRGQRDLVDKTNTANQGLASIRATLQGKVDDNAEAIQAIDAYRVAVNSRLANIERRMSQRGTPAVQ